MSYHLGIAHHLPSLHRQLTSPTANGFPKAVPDEDLTEDSKDVLIERLNDLVARLSNARNIDDVAVTAIHSQMDRIELIVRREERHQSPLDGTVASLDVLRDEDNFWGPPSPSQSLRMRLPPKPGSAVLPQHQRELSMSTAKAVKIAKEAEELASILSTTIKELQTRREESDVSISIVSMQYF